MSHSRYPLGREKDFFASPPSFLGTRKTDFFFPLAVCVYTYVVCVCLFIAFVILRALSEKSA